MRWAVVAMVRFVLTAVLVLAAVVGGVSAGPVAANIPDAPRPNPPNRVFLPLTPNRSDRPALEGVGLMIGRSDVLSATWRNPPPNLPPCAFEATGPYGQTVGYAESWRRVWEDEASVSAVVANPGFPYWLVPTERSSPNVTIRVVCGDLEATSRL